MVLQFSGWVLTFSTMSNFKIDFNLHSFTHILYMHYFLTSFFLYYRNSPLIACCIMFTKMFLSSLFQRTNWMNLSLSLSLSLPLSLSAPLFHPLSFSNSIRCELITCIRLSVLNVQLLPNCQAYFKHLTFYDYDCLHHYC